MLTARVRELLLDQFDMIMVYWRKEDVEPYFADVVEIVDAGLNDGRDEIRKVARQATANIISAWCVTKSVPWLIAVIQTNRGVHL